MSKGTQLWPGDRMREFFSAHIRRETSLDEVGAKRLAEALTKAVNRMLVWEMPAAPQPAAAAEKTEVTKRHARAENFNPYLFSAIVVLAKQGREGLIKRLQEIKSAEHLRAFAEAQHVPVDAKLRKLDDIRKAIVAAVEQRLADRKAAAS
ncbi:hypothetical protein [Hyphomicrobium sp.]|jgi:hypothetical protein|uniref:hypothetical protein n=1 Tax=Hyphomicrobium sp. TaxID=82 RepID=UPI002CC965D3|nr:hypothetical protein [Hyphomicrobium sp.]HVZ04663.1 hypothetical protein [Hyphomicrobium sp.]